MKKYDFLRAWHNVTLRCHAVWSLCVTPPWRSMSRSKPRFFRKWTNISPISKILSPIDSSRRDASIGERIFEIAKIHEHFWKIMIFLICLLYRERHKMCTAGRDAPCHAQGVQTKKNRIQVTLTKKYESHNARKLKVASRPGRLTCLIIKKSGFFFWGVRIFGNLLHKP